MPIELRPVTKSMDLRAERDGTHRGQVHGAEVVAVLAGIGPAAAARTTQRWLLELAPAHVVVVGVAGGVRPDLAIGSLVIPAVAAATEDAEPSRLGSTWRASPLGDAVLAGTLVTTRDLITDPAVHAAHRAAGVDAVDMETAAVAQVCDDAGVPWTAFRGISDHVDEGLLADRSILAILGPDGAPKLGAAARLVARRPRLLGSFARLGLGSVRATRAAARAAAEAISTDVRS
jgi:nucleoside phosphorylase